MSGEYWPHSLYNGRILYKKITQENHGEQWYLYKANQNTDSSDRAQWSLFYTKQEDEIHPSRQHLQESDQGFEFIELNAIISITLVGRLSYERLTFYRGGLFIGVD